MLSAGYSGQCIGGTFSGLGKLTTYDGHGMAIETRTGNWEKGKPHGRNVFQDLRTGAWVDYKWNKGGFWGDRDVRWRFKDGTLYEGTFKWRKGGEREGNGTLYGAKGQVKMRF